jgi:hypothetical protein
MPACKREPQKTAESIPKNSGAAAQDRKNGGARPQKQQQRQPVEKRKGNREGPENSTSCAPASSAARPQCQSALPVAAAVAQQAIRAN